MQKQKYYQAMNLELLGVVERSVFRLFKWSKVLSSDANKCWYSSDNMKQYMGYENRLNKEV